MREAPPLGSRERAFSPVAWPGPDSQRLWHLLAVVSRFEVEVLAGSDSLARHRGAGEIQVEPGPGPDAGLIWTERGCWRAGPLAGVRFWNRTCWRLDAGRGIVECGHLRRGFDRPVVLARLDPVGPDRWLAEEPHRCGADLYHVELRLQPQALEVSWRVESPSDPYRLRLSSYPAAEPSASPP